MFFEQVKGWAGSARYHPLIVLPVSLSSARPAHAKRCNMRVLCALVATPAGSGSQRERSEAGGLAPAPRLEEALMVVKWGGVLVRV